MSVTVTVRIAGVDLQRVREVAETHPDLHGQLRDLLKRHGSIKHTRYYHDNQILDIDEWETEEGFRAFLEAARPIINQLAELRGTEIPTDEVWYPY